MLLLDLVLVLEFFCILRIILGRTLGRLDILFLLDDFVLRP